MLAHIVQWPLIILMCNFAIGATRYELPFNVNTNDTAGNLTHSSDVDPGQRIPIFVGGFFAFPGNPIFGALPETVKKAIDHVNNLSGILDGYELRMRHRVTNGSPIEALELLNDLLYNGPHLLMTWGPILSRQALVVNEVSPLYNLVQVCLANSQALRDRERYRLTVQMYWSEDSVNPTRVAFMRYMGWTKVAIIFEDNEYFRANSDDLRVKLEAANVSVIATEAISDASHPDQQLRSLMRHDARIIFALSYFDTAIKLFCKIYEFEMFGAKYVWTVVGWYPERWWEQVGDGDCTADQLEKVLQYHLSVPAWRSVEDVGQIQYNDIEPPVDQLEFIRGLLAREGVDRLEHIESYDVLITIALALNRSMEKLARLDPPRTLHEFTYSDGEMAAVLLESVYETRFTGPTGPVVIEDGGFRLENKVRFFIAQFRDGKMWEIAEYSNHSKSFEILNGMAFNWSGGSPPVDGRTLRRQHQAISRLVQMMLFILASSGIILALVFLAINVKFRRQRAIKISTPTLNNLIVIGSVMLYASVFVFGVDDPNLSGDGLIMICHLRNCLVCVGVSMGFGALFMKTYRIHAIFSRAVEKLKRVDLPNYKLILGVVFAVTVDFVVFALWISLGQVYVDKTESTPVLDISEQDKEIYVVYVIAYCTSEYMTYFTGAIYLTKGILLAFGIFLAWETRRITVSSLNDSKYIAMSIYTVAISLVVVLPALTLDVVRNNVTVNFLVLASAIIMTTTTVLCLVFLPKIYLLYCSTGRKNFRISMMSKYGSNGSLSTFNECATASSVKLQEKLQNKEEELRKLVSHLDVTVLELTTKRVETTRLEPIRNRNTHM